MAQDYIQTDPEESVMYLDCRAWDVNVVELLGKGFYMIWCISANFFKRTNYLSQVNDSLSMLSDHILSHYLFCHCIVCQSLSLRPRPEGIRALTTYIQSMER